MSTLRSVHYQRFHCIHTQEEEEPKESTKLSKKKLRKLNRLTVAQLKQLVDRPDVVEMHDVTAQDPKLLIHLKVGHRGFVDYGGTSKQGTLWG